LFGPFVGSPAAGAAGRSEIASEFMAHWLVILIAALIAIAIAGAVWAWPSAAARRQQSVARRPRPVARSPFHCVAIAHASVSCEAVRKLEGKRMLPQEAMHFTLPLAECDCALCRCHYVHYDDRRQEQRRSQFREGAHDGREKRFGRDRRGQRTFPEIPGASRGLRKAAR